MSIQAVAQLQEFLARDYSAMPRLMPWDFLPENVAFHKSRERIYKAFDIKPHFSRPLGNPLFIGRDMLQQNDWRNDRCQMHKYGIFCNEPGTPFKDERDDRFCAGHKLKLKMRVHKLQHDLEVRQHEEFSRAATQCPHDWKDDKWECKHCHMTPELIKSHGGTPPPLAKGDLGSLPEQVDGKVIAFPSSRKEKIKR